MTKSQINTRVPFDKQTPIYNAIASELISLTPETWTNILLEVSVKKVDEITSMPHKISSPTGRRELVVPNDKLMELTHELHVLFVQHNSPWKKIDFNVEQAPDGNWSFKCDYTY